VEHPASSPPQTARSIKRPERSQLSPCASPKRGGHWPGAPDLPLLVLDHSRRGLCIPRGRPRLGSGRKRPAGSHERCAPPLVVHVRRSHVGDGRSSVCHWRAPAGPTRVAREAASMTTSPHTTLSALGELPVTAHQRGPRGGPSGLASGATLALNRRRRFGWLSDDLGGFGRGLGPPADAF